MKLLSVKEAAGRLGISVATLRAWIWKRQIEIVKIGRAIRIKDETLDTLIANGTIPAKQQNSD